MRLKLPFTVLLAGIVSSFSFAQSNVDTNKTIKKNEITAKLAAKQFDMTTANRPEMLNEVLRADNATPARYTTSNNGDNDITAFARIEGERWGALSNIEDDSSVYFSSELNGTNFNVTIYDEDFNEENFLSISVPSSANRVELINHYSTNFFDDSNDSAELMVYVHYFDPDILGPDGQISEIWVFDDNGDVITTLEGNSAWAKYDDQGNKRIYSYLLDTYDGAFIYEYDMENFEEINLYTIGDDLLNYFMGIPFDFVTIGGQEYLIVSHYESEFMDNMNLEVYPNNHLIVKLLDYDFQEVKSMEFNIDSRLDSGMYVAPMAEFGTFLQKDGKNYNISTDIFNSDEDIEVVYGIYYYDMMADSEWSTFTLASEDGTILETLDDYIIAINWDMLSIPGHDTQIGFLLSDDGSDANMLGFFDLESWEMATTFEAMNGEDLLSDKFNRIPYQDTYHYLIGIADPDYDNGNVYGVINEYTIDGDLHKRNQLYVPVDVELFTPILTSDVLEPNIFTTINDDFHFIYVYLEKNTDGTIFNNIVIASDADNILVEFRGDTADGNIVGAGLVKDLDDIDYDKLSLQYEAGASSVLIDFYKLPLTSSLGVDDIVNNSFAVYPNPSNGIINVTSNIEAKGIQVYSMTGKLLHSQVLNNTQSTINISSLAQGIYIAHINLEDGTTQKVKLIKQ